MITANTVLLELEALVYKDVTSFKNEKVALSCISAMENCLYLNFKNKLMYIPSTNKKDKQDLQQLYATIYKEFTGKNQQELAIKYGRSEQNIYSLIKRERNSHIRKLQSDIFPQEPEEDTKPITLLVIECYLPPELTYSGLSENEAKELSIKISTHLCLTFPGVSIYISKAIKDKKSNKNQTSLF